jgi:hypothetical protein
MSLSLLQKQALINQEPKLSQFLNDNRRETAYDDLILGMASQLWDKPITNGRSTKRFDANSVLQTYEMAIDLDKRIVEQVVEQSWLRKSFANFPSEKIFFEYTGVSATEKVYVPQLFSASGIDNTGNAGSGKEWEDPSEMRIIKGSTQVLRRPIKISREGFYLSLYDLEVAAAHNLPLQQMFSNRVARDLGLLEQNFALFNANGSLPEEKGLLQNSAINSSITTTVVWANATTGRAIVDDIVRINSKIIDNTKGVFEPAPFCLLVSLLNLKLLNRTFSDLQGRSVVDYLTDRGFRIAGIPAIPANTMIAYYNDPMHLELSTSRIIEALPQSYDATKVAYFLPYQNVTAGLTVKIPEAVYSISGIG